jgi:hypothetical protein
VKQASPCGPTGLNLNKDCGIIQIELAARRLNRNVTGIVQQSTHNPELAPFKPDT